MVHTKVRDMTFKQTCMEGDSSPGNPGRRFFQAEGKARAPH